MNHMDCWNKFEQTGAILDYLNYTACAKESMDETMEDMTGMHLEEGEESGSSQCNRNGFVDHANW